MSNNPSPIDDLVERDMRELRRMLDDWQAFKRRIFRFGRSAAYFMAFAALVVAIGGYRGG